MKKKLLWGLIPLVLAGMGAVEAAGVRTYQEGEAVNPNDIANMLRGKATAHKPKMRGIALDPAYQKPAPAPAPPPAPVYQAPEPPTQVASAEPAEESFALPVRFGFNSAEILPEAMPQIDAVAEGIKQVPGVRVVIEGHTDASGSASYNRRLSRRRASAVKQYLVYRHGISAKRLIVEGKGESSPLDPANPYAPENRRVQFRAAQ